jgi:hypothetical protein
VRAIRADEVKSADWVLIRGLTEKYRLVEGARLVDLGSGSLDYVELTIWAPVTLSGADAMVCVTVEREIYVRTCAGTRRGDG